MRHPVVFNWIGGAKFLAGTGDQGLTGNIYTGLFEFSDMGFVIHFLRKDDLFIDVGANAGVYSILAGSVVGASGYAFEPVPRAYERLKENLRLNHLENRITPLPIAISNQKGLLKISDGHNCNNRVLQNDDDLSSVTVEAATLDDVLEGRNPSLLKIDVEGYELSVLQGAKKILAKSSLRGIIMETDGQGSKYGFQESDILSLLQEHGFTGYAYDPFERKLSEPEAGASGSRNTIFIRDRDFVSDRIRSAEKFSVRGKSL